MAGVGEAVESICVDDAKCVAGFPAAQMNLALANAVSMQKAMDQILLSTVAAAAQLTQTIAARCVNEVLSTRMQAAVGDVKAGTGDDIAYRQQAMKGAQTTPPQTA